MFQSEFGSPVISGGRPFFRSEKDTMGFVLYGPYEVYPPGIYSVAFTVLPDENDTIPSDGLGGRVLCGYADVTSSSGTLVLEKTNLYLHRMLRDGGIVHLAFELHEPRELEFRVFSTGKVRLKVSTGVTAASIATKDFSPVLDPGVLSTDAFFIANFVHFRNLHESGSDITVTPRGAVCDVRGVSFYLKTTDDLQIAHEIFTLREYDVALGRATLAVDIGMNVGLSSLYLARDPDVVEVHGFEPFHHPFTRAQENLRLNPRLSAKVVPTRIGLAGEDRDLSVLTSTESPIGTSIRGNSTGVPETIVVRDAAPVFAALLARAKSNGWEVVVKIDCEGSEFAIIESLAAADLLRQIRVVLIEWHKWWSADRSQADLVRPLMANGFAIFDRTVASNQWAGMLFGVRMGDPRSH